MGVDNLAVLFWKQERYDEGEPLMKRVLAIRGKALGPDHDLVGTVGLASSWRALNKKKFLVVWMVVRQFSRSDFCSGHKRLHQVSRSVPSIAI